MIWEAWHRHIEPRPQSSLHPLLFAQRRLYRSVGIGGKCAIDTGEVICRKFHRTIKDEPGLASLVRELRLQTTNSKFSAGLEKSLVQVLGVCKIVESVRSEWSPGFLGELKNALKQMDLAELFVSCNPNAKTSLEFTSPSDVSIYRFGPACKGSLRKASSTISTTRTSSPSPRI